jgi:hypothetical protein
MPEVWTPGAAGPEVEFVTRILRQVAQYGERAAVSVELKDGALFELISLSPDPGFGFITLRPHPEDEEPTELIVPIGAIAQIRLHAPEVRPKFGFTGPVAEPVPPPKPKAKPRKK